MQPWHFVAVADAALKRRIRAGAEAEEREFYAHRAPAEWLRGARAARHRRRQAVPGDRALADRRLRQRYGLLPDGRKVKHYYPLESVGIATGLLIAALHQVGLACLTHTPSPMGFLNEILGRSGNERPFLVLVVGYPAADARVPDIARKPLEEIATFL